MSDFILLVDGERYGSWKTIRATRGLERAAADFALSVSHRDPWPISNGAACSIYIDQDLLLTGWIDAVRPRVESEAHDIEITGRSKTCDFIDSSADVKGGQLNGLTVLQIAELLAEPSGLTVLAEVDSEPVPEVQLQQSETCFALVERLARLQELLVTDDNEGNLVLTRAGQGRADTALLYGQNVKAASADFDDHDRFSHYIVKAQRPGNRTMDDFWDTDNWGESPNRGGLHGSPDQTRALWRQRRLRTVQLGPQGRVVGRDFAVSSPGLRTASGLDINDGEDDADEDLGNWSDVGNGEDTKTRRGAAVINEIVGTARDYGITRYRPKIMVAEAQADDAAAAQRADWEKRRRIAKAIKASVTVNGWRQASGDLWRPNLMTYVNIPWLGLDRELLISETVFSVDESGEITTLALSLPDAFLPDPKRKPRLVRAGAKGSKGASKGKGVAGDNWADVI